MESSIFRDLFQGLVVYGLDRRILPGIAESWQASVDGQVYTFDLRPDARWSDGDPLTAYDMV